VEDLVDTRPGKADSGGDLGDRRSLSLGSQDRLPEHLTGSCHFAGSPLGSLQV
jgi:hypothetical protein